MAVSSRKEEIEMKKVFLKALIVVMLAAGSGLVVGTVVKRGLQVVEARCFQADKAFWQSINR